MDFHDFGVWVPQGLTGQPVAPIETFARFQAGFLSSEDFHCFLSIFIDFHGSTWIFIDFHRFCRIFEISEHVCWRGLEVGPAATIETFARFQAGFLPSEDFHCFLSIFTDFMISMDC